jgi:hypothetical protein
LRDLLIDRTYARPAVKFTECSDAIEFARHLNLPQATQEDLSVSLSPSTTCVVLRQVEERHRLEARPALIRIAYRALDAPTYQAEREDYQRTRHQLRRLGVTFSSERAMLSICTLVKLIELNEAEQQALSPDDAQAYTRAFVGRLNFLRQHEPSLRAIGCNYMRRGPSLTLLDVTGYFYPTLN